MGAAAQRKRTRQAAMTRLRKSVEAQPEYAAMRAAHEADEDLHARWRADFPEQARRLERAGWRQLRQSADGAGMWGQPDDELRMIHSVLRWEDGQIWAQASLMGPRGQLPSWGQLLSLHQLLYPERAGVQVMPAVDQHVSIADVLHVWTCLTAPSVPDFGKFGTI